MKSPQWEQKVGWRRKVAMNLWPFTWKQTSKKDMRLMQLKRWIAGTWYPDSYSILHVWNNLHYLRHSIATSHKNHSVTDFSLGCAPKATSFKHVFSLTDIQYTLKLSLVFSLARSHLMHPSLHGSSPLFPRESSLLFPELPLGEGLLLLSRPLKLDLDVELAVGLEVHLGKEENIDFSYFVFNYLIRRLFAVWFGSWHSMYVGINSFIPVSASWNYYG